MSSQSTTAQSQIDTAGLIADAAAIAASDAYLQAESTKLGAVIRELIEICSSTISRKATSPIIEQDADGDNSRTDWAGIKFAGGRKQRHVVGGVGCSTRCWSIYGQSAYITAQGRIYLIDWSGSATDFSGPGYDDIISSDYNVDELESHLMECPESAVEIVDTLRKLVAEDKAARKTLTAEIAAVLARLR